MNLYIKTSLQLLIISTLLSSCAVQNNLYYHNANPYEKGEGNSYVALSTGLQAKVDSVNSDGAIHYSDKLKSNVNLNIGVDYGIARNLTLRGAIHLPMVIGGFGLRGGAQYSILPEDSDFNIALGADFGFVTSRDSFTIFGDVTFEGEAKTKGIIPRWIKNIDTNSIFKVE